MLKSETIGKLCSIAAVLAVLIYSLPYEFFINVLIAALTLIFSLFYKIDWFMKRKTDSRNNNCEG